MPRQLERGLAGLDGGYDLGGDIGVEVTLG
jgi:hypothetical protein